MSAPGDIVLEARGIVKTFPGVRALDGVDLTLRRGRMTALLGENGAGKSTLMNVLAGVFPPDAGTLTREGRAVAFRSPHEARERGIATIFQELSVLPNLSVAENIFVGREPRNRWGLIDYAMLHRDARTLLGRVGLPVAPEARAGDLRVGQRQLVEIARALSTDPRVLIMDEPTSALSEHDVEVLFTLIAGLKRDGVAIVYITHKLEELERACDDVVIMRDGRVVGAADRAAISLPEIIRLMAGREARDVPRKVSSAGGEEVLRVEAVSLRRDARGDDLVVRDVSLDLRRGEVLGVFGLMGAGRTELLETICGLHPDRSAGRVFVSGAAVRIHSPSDALAHGLALAPEDRKRDGLVLEMSVLENAALACLDRAVRFGWLDARREAALVAPLLERFRVRAGSLRQSVRQLSGGNQQKVILAKWLAAAPRVILLDEPTRGIDINAKREIYALIDELAQRGLGVVLVSSELPEVLALSDRVMVMCDGRKTAEFARAEATPEAVLRAALPRAA